VNTFRRLQDGSRPSRLRSNRSAGWRRAASAQTLPTAVAIPSTQRYPSMPASQNWTPLSTHVRSNSPNSRRTRSSNAGRPPSPDRG
jgi:hypothetical protein